ncbi:calnexin isoform X1 [Nilaparvata lugens]|uniref:calnexin isoform X1 n=1 Tax=Nilaparvata lugens TaxID=108931 RepID=UPI00193D670A|nr:calnexin isoform X1 [Nilaparvata lugens]XP_039295272.1 calnexin isoform X1 [Nilaparvata lugens]
MLLFSLSRHATLVAFLATTVLLISVARGDEVDKEDETLATVETVEGEVLDDDDIVYVTPTLPAGISKNSVYLAEHFDNPHEFEKKWIKSEAKKEGIDDSIAKYDGEWALETAQRNALRGDMGLVLKSKAKHSAISSRLTRPFVFDSKPLVVQYEVLLQEGQECGGAYLKLISHSPTAKDNNLKLFHDKTPYTIMFGPDKCGNDYKLHFIFRHKNPLNNTMSEKHCKKPKERIEDQFTDKLPHLYTLIVRPDNTFQIYINHKVVNEGSLLEDFTPPVNPAEEIDDPSDVRPADWDDRERIPDPTATKPDDWDEEAPQFVKDPSATRPDNWLDDEPENIPDPAAEKPSDWDEEIDGDWEAPLVPNPACEEAAGCGEWVAPDIPNPEYKGKWRPPLVDNPNYQGKWAPRRIPNPDYFEDRDPFRMTAIGAVGLELWSMSNQILFDNILVTDDPAIADGWAAQTYDIKRKKMDKVAESVISAILRYTNEHPWLWAVYIVAIILPIVLIVAFCFGSSSQEKEEQKRAAEAKKTDAVQEDDERAGEEAAEAVGEEGEEEDEEEGGEEEEEEEEQGEGDAAEQTKQRKEPEGKESVSKSATEGAGDAAPPSPRKRKTRKD